MEWTATAKELEAHGFRVGLDKIFKDFKYMYLVILPIAGGKCHPTFLILPRRQALITNAFLLVMIYLGTYAPRGWIITDFTAIVPLANQIGCHALLPVCIVIILGSILLMLLL